MTTPFSKHPPRLMLGRAGLGGGLVIFAAVSVTYLLLAQFVLWLNDPVFLGAGFWPAGGVTIAALLLLPTSRWRWVIAGVAVAELGGDLVHGYPLAAALSWTAGNCVGPLVGAWLIRRFSDPRGALVPLRSLVAFLFFGVIAGPVVGATLGSIGSVVVLGNPVWQVWPKYVVGDALGVLVVAPALLAWHTRSSPRTNLERTAFLVVLLTSAPLVFRNWNAAWDVTLPYLIIPVLMWAALRFGVRGAAWAVLWVTQVANVATAVGYGPFARVGEATGHAVTTLQLYLMIAAVTALIVAALVHELSDHQQVGEGLRRQARTDALTGLPNRVHLTERLEQALSKAPEERGRVALLMCDLDRFKIINDGLGHQAGDEVLIEVAQRLRSCVRTGDVAVRLGGDEFVLLVHATEDALESLTARVLRVIAEPIVLTTGHHVSAAASIGVAVAAPDHDPQTLLRDADVAMYHAKERGRGRAERFDEALRVNALDRFKLPEELRAALAAKELHCVYQPEIDLLTGDLFGLEALVRWDHPERGHLLPGAFVPLAEEVGLATALFEFVIDQSLADQQQWVRQLGFHPRISVNLSPYQLRDPSLPGAVAQALTRWGAPAETLWLEVTESAIADTAALPTLFALHDLGVHLAVDDFGTGWSSLARLSKFPWDLLKIDRSFVSKLGKDPQAEHVVRAMVVMAHALGMRTVAEGVETHEQLELVASMNCDVAQGYLFARPLSSRDAMSQVTPAGRWQGQPGVIAHAPPEATSAQAEASMAVGQDSLLKGVSASVIAPDHHLADSIDHRAHFYDAEPVLIDSVISFLAPAVSTGVAVIIATQEHRSRFVQALADSGVDTLQAFAENRLVTLDASDTLQLLLHGGRIDSGAVETTIGTVLDAATSRGGPVHVYGEMVSLLCENDDVAGALELEQCWNELGRTRRFALLCGYASWMTDTILSPEQLLGIRHEHSLVTTADKALKQACDRSVASHARQRRSTYLA